MRRLVVGLGVTVFLGATALWWWSSRSIEPRASLEPTSVPVPIVPADVSTFIEPPLLAADSGLVRLAGIVTGPDGGTVAAHVTIDCLDNVEHDADEATTGRDGRFAVDVLPPRSCVLYGNADDDMHGQVDWRPDGGFIALKLIREPGQLRGRVRDEKGQPVLAFVLTVLQTIGKDDSERERTIFSPDGTFALDGLTVGTTSVRVDANGFRPSRAYEVDISAEQGPIVEIVLSQGVGVSGVVVDAKTHQPLASAEVELLGRHALDGPASTLTDSAGRFSVSGTPVGTTQIAVRHAGYLTQQLPLGELAGESAPITIELHANDGQPGAEHQGIGARLGPWDDDCYPVDGFAKGSDARAAGLHEKDCIIAVDGESLEGDTESDLLRLRGAENSVAKLTVRRQGHTLAISVVRHRIVSR